MKKLLLLFAIAFFCVTKVSADVQIRDLYYYLNHSNYTASVSRPNHGWENSPTVYIPNSITYQGGRYVVDWISEHAFYLDHFMTSVTIGDNVETIGVSAFDGCDNLRSVTIGKKVNWICQSAFSSCTSLTSIEIPNNVTIIDKWAFAFCNALKSITNYAKVPQDLDYRTFWEVNLAECTLYVPAEAIDLYKEAETWKDFGKIRAIGSGFEVIFKDWDDSILSIQEVYEGDAAIAPTNPSREGYTFVGWDKEFTNITEDLVVTAQYKINRYEVIFKDWDGTVLKSDSVDWNTAAIAPANPSREGYEFIGWDKEFSQVIENMTITAQYEFGENKTVTVIFANGNDESEILSQQLILKVPLAPEIDGFTFLGWFPVASTFAEPENTITIQAVYQADIPSSAPAVYTNPANPAQKLIRNGYVYILTDDKTYTITGLQVK